ncbi:NACHT domain-containing protein [Micromonospora sp. CA-111912]|uniref:NACHT domain-containing protein n=1 Tax=Micromonospora sp. CA-111912 TaxID=3239955 RepID=UPI003D8D0DFF
MRLIKGYFVTRDEPQPEQRAAIARLGAPVVACSMAQLRGQLINSLEYLTIRPSYPFGSARDPVSGKTNPKESYVPLEFGVVGGGDPVGLQYIASQVGSGHCVALIGDYGAGKSMTIREVFKKLAESHRRGDRRFPVVLNLRDHQGQRDPDEALERHARKIGFEGRSQLVRAWLAGDVHLLLDGFDEIATPGWMGRATSWRDIRRLATDLVRKFIDGTPDGSGIFITGRTHFFDSLQEARSSLGLPLSAKIFTTSDFTESQISAYLKRYDWAEALPEWLPSRPLLLGYLVATGLLKEALATDGYSSAAAAWDVLLDKITEREARNSSDAFVEGSTIRLIIERLATTARARLDGMGPLAPNDLTNAFTSVVGSPPDEGSYQILQRLPGLGVQDESSGSRYFIDSSLADAARAGDVTRWLTDHYSDKSLLAIRGTAAVMESLGIDMVVERLVASAVKGTQAGAAAAAFQREGGADGILLDMLQAAKRLQDFKTSASLSLEGLLIPTLSIDDDSSLRDVVFTDSVIQHMDLTEFEGDSKMPTFVRCVFGLIEGVASVEALPGGSFIDCDYEQFDAAARTTRGILGIVSLTPRQRVALTVLKKLYVQRGVGRREGSLYRGLDDKHRALVPDVISVLTSAGFALRAKQASNVLILPARGQAVRVRRLLEAPVQSREEFFASL